MNNSQRYEQIKPTIIEQLTQTIIDAQLDGYRQLPHERIAALVKVATDKIQEGFENPDSNVFAQYWQEITRQRLSQGIPLNSVLQVIEMADDVIQTVVRSQEQFNPEDKLLLVTDLNKATRSAIIAMYHVYEESYNRLLQAQESAIRELSTPIVPIHEGILVLPIVGSIDSARAATIIEELLEAITFNQADVVIMDITGVPVIDTGIANYLLQAARAVRLLGSQIILVGISAEIAQTIVQLGIDLTGITTRANLQSGIEYALGLLDLAICSQSLLEDSAQERS